MSFIDLMLCNYYIISVMIILYYVKILEIFPQLCYLMSFIDLMLCNYYIISVMIIMLYHVNILEMQFIASYDND